MRTKVNKTQLFIIIISLVLLFGIIAAILLNTSTNGNIAQGSSEIISEALVSEQNVVLSQSVNEINEQDISIDNDYAVTLKQETDFIFWFYCDISGSYCFNVAYGNVYVPLQITVSDVNGSVIDHQVVVLPKASDNLAQYYTIKFDLTATTDYKINVNYGAYGVPELQVNANLSLWKRFDRILLNDAVLFSQGTINDNKHIILGESYNLSFNYENNFQPSSANPNNWKINDASNPDYISLTANGFSVINNELNEHQEIKIDFWDYEGYYTLTFHIKRPIYASGKLDPSSYDYVLTFKNSYGENVLANDSGFVSMNLDINGIEVNNITSSTYNIIRLPILESYTNVTAVAKFTLNGISYQQNISNVSVRNYIINIADYNTSSVTGDNMRVIIQGAQSNKTIDIADTVTAIFFTENSNSVWTNLKININTSNPCLLYLNGLKITSSDASSNTIQSASSLLTISVNNTNSIKGKASTALINTKGLEFCGTGSLDVIGDNGVNGVNGQPGSNGTDGTHGFSAVQCSSVSLCVGATANITLKGGDGGNGGHGGNGTKGTPGQCSENIDPAGAVKGGDGTRGGNGGKGGNCGKGCNLSVAGITIIDGFAGRGGNGGRGGDGGDGANAAIVNVPFTSNYTCLAPSDGGNGGRGGDAGKSGSGELKSGVTHPIGGNGGNGGRGGDGAGISFYPSGGWLSLLYSSVDARHGGNGGRGGDGYFGGNGGIGGRGGTGARGSDGSITQKVGDGRQGGNSGNSGNGGNSYSSVSNVGAGGRSVAGGIGGQPGSPVISSNAGSQGPSGAPGAAGQSGVYDSGSSCVANGTLITLADGRQVPVETLKGDELLLVWNLFTGQFDVAPILFIDSDPATEYEVITLYFSDGTSVKIIDEHAFWDFNLNEYVFLRNDAARYIGHWFNKQTTDASGNLTWTKVQLTNVVIQTENTSAWSPVTYGHLCYYVNGMLSMPGATTGLINIFDVDPDTMKIDEAAMQSDIAKYGLFTYEEFAALYPIPEVIFEAFGGQYLKVALGKGILTEETLVNLIQRYSPFFN